MKWFVPRKLSTGEDRDAKNLISMLEARTSRRVSDGVEFIKHCELNDLEESSVQALAAYVVCLRRYKATTVATKIRNVRWYLRREKQTVTVNDILHHFDVLAARERIRKAPRVPLADMLAFLDRPDATIGISIKHHARICFLLLTGLRNADANYLTNSGIRWSMTGLDVEVRLAKNRTSIRDRVILHLPFNSSLWKNFSPRTRQAVRLARFGDDEVIPTHKLNASLRKVGGTTYSLRRLYVNDTVERYRRFDGTVDYDCVRQRTLHFSSDTIQAYYEEFIELPAANVPARHAHFLDDMFGA